MGRTGDRGQATVEFALVLPVAALLVLGIVQVVAVARDQLTVEYAAREAARAAAVAADPAAAAFEPAHLQSAVAAALIAGFGKPVFRPLSEYCAPPTGAGFSLSRPECVRRCL
ncbi:MAG: TadE family protein, partial [Ilumatobacteraceae bacterium]